MDRILPKLNGKIKEIITVVDDGNVARFSKRLKNVSQQRLNRIFNPDTRTGKYPGVPDDVLVSIATSMPNVNLDWLLADRGEMANAPAVIPLTNNVWPAGALTANAAANYYSFTASSGTVYHIQWDDARQGSGAYSVDIKVSASYADNTEIFAEIDTAYNQPWSFTASKSGVVTIKAEGANGGSTGTYAIKYYTGNASPTLSFISVTPPDKTTYTVGEAFSTTGLVVTAPPLCVREPEPRL